MKARDLCIFCQLVYSFSIVCFQGNAFPFQSNHLFRQTKRGSFALPAIAIPVSELEKELSAEERSITAVVRKCGPSVAFVISIWSTEEQEDGRDETEPRWFSRQRSRRRQQQQRTDPPKNDTQPRGRSLGSGSGFVIDSDGYVTTNYHVIEFAYRLQSMSQMFDEFITNLTDPKSNEAWWGSPLSPLLANITSMVLSQLPIRRRPVPQVWVRINSSTQYQLCRIVDVKPELDVAVLKIITPNNISNSNNATTTAWPPVSFGVSSNLLVGQRVVAIGNPFGLDTTVTTGVVSALNRDLAITPVPLPRGVAVTTASVIRNCIQTDAAINPGNSGGPLLNTQGQVVGVNTAIVSTTGSNAGIGFAIPSDSIAPVVQSMIREDRRRTYQLTTSSRPALGYLGVSILRRNTVPPEDADVVSRLRNDVIIRKPLNWVTYVQPDSPAQAAGIRPVVIVSSESQAVWGDAIVAVGGRQVTTFDELQSEFDRRVAGEQVALTLEDVNGDRRVVYVTLRSTALTK
jgi:S1-C subfamily serine protease